MPARCSFERLLGIGLTPASDQQANCWVLVRLAKSTDTKTDTQKSSIFLDLHPRQEAPRVCY